MENSSKNIKRTKSTKANIETKPTKKLKTNPPVRHTLTSYKRMLKANPLLKYQEAGIDDQLLRLGSAGTNLKSGTDLAIPNFKSSAMVENKASTEEFKKPETIIRTLSLKIPKSNRPEVRTKKPLIISGNLPLTNNHFKKTTKMSLGSNSNTNTAKSKSENSFPYTSSKIEDQNSVYPKTKSNLLPNNFIALQCKSENNTKKPTLKTENNVEKPNHQIVRRSLSSDADYQNKKGSKLKQCGQPSKNTSLILANFSPEISPIKDENTDFIFKSPSAYERRSTCSFSPHSSKRGFLFNTSTPACTDTQHLEERLLRLLKSRGKPLSSFKNLRYFGKKKQRKTSVILVDDENKENIKIKKENEQSSENSKILTTPKSSRIDIQDQNDSLEEELSQVAKKAMVELLELIQEDHPESQSLGWLELIKEKYRKANDEPEYWECRAAIEQSIGNVGNAVEFYKTAIVQGAEVSNVDKSLDQLITKFSLL